MRSIATLIVASVFTLVAASGCYDTVPAGIDYSSAGEPRPDRGHRDPGRWSCWDD